MKARATILLATAFMLIGCETRRGEAVVLEKEFIAAREPTPTPSPDPTSEEEDPPGVTVREMAPDEIDVDGYVMKGDVRGTGRDPRALAHPQWLVKVRLVDDGRILRVPTEKERFDALEPGARVRVAYRVGKYTDAAWSARFE